MTLYNKIFQIYISFIIFLLYLPIELLICCPWSDSLPSRHHLLWYHCVWLSPRSQRGGPEC